MADVISYWYNIIKDLVAALFTYEIVSGVNFGSFIIAVFLMGFMLKVLFTNYIKK